MECAPQQSQRRVASAARADPSGPTSPAATEVVCFYRRTWKFVALVTMFVIGGFFVSLSSQSSIYVQRFRLIMTDAQ
jgi:hypothetical protein